MSRNSPCGPDGRSRRAWPVSPERPGSGRGALPFDRDGTVLITGGTGGLGSHVARHLAAEHGPATCCCSAGAAGTPRASPGWSANSSATAPG
ncbi:KR domain-containing protein [Streptomyces sp. M19]